MFLNFHSLQLVVETGLTGINNYEHGMKIQSAFHGGEQKIGKYKVDGRSVFEFYGDYWHAHPDKFPNENGLSIILL